MSNEVFAQYATGAAFAVQLSKNQCNMILRIHAATMDFNETEVGKRFMQWKESGLDVLQVGSMRSLEARGLLFWHRKPDGTANGFGGLTKAGKLTAELLLEAGMTVENTNTVSVLKRIMQQEAA